MLWIRIAGPDSQTKSNLTHPRGSMIVTRNLYFAIPGKRDDVLAIRKHANEVRARIGLPRGVIYTTVDPNPGQPDVIWEQEFDSLDSAQRDLAVRDESPEFNAVRARMRTLLSHFLVETYERLDENSNVAAGLDREHSPAFLQVPGQRLTHVDHFDP